MLTEAIGIHTTPGRLDIRSSPARLSVEQPPAQVSIDSRQPPLAISTQRPQVSVDSTVPRQEVGYYQPVAFAQQFRETSKAASQEAIAHTVQAGDAYRESGQRGHGVPRDPAGQPQRDWNIAFKPQTRPAVDFSPGSVAIHTGYSPPRIQISPRQPIVEVQAQPTAINYAPASVRMHVRPNTVLGGLLDTTA